MLLADQLGQHNPKYLLQAMGLEGKMCPVLNFEGLTR